MEYMVSIEAKKFNQSVRQFEFNWMGQPMRSPDKVIKVQLAAENEQDLAVMVESYGNGTVTLISYSTVTEEDTTQLEAINAVITVPPIEILKLCTVNPSSVGVN